MKIAQIPCFQQGSLYKKITYLLASLLLLSLSGCAEEEVAPVAVTSVTLDAASMELLEGESYTLTATISPSNADNQKIIWASSNVSVVSVKEGVVTALKAGKATITAKSDDGGKTATCEVAVNAKVYLVENVSLDRTSVELTEGEEITLTATVKPDNAANKSVTWSSSNPYVAEVVDGKVSALTPGTSTITVKTEDGGKTATCEIIVHAKVYPVENVSLDRTSVDLTEGEEITLTATVKPDNATNKSVTWSSSDPSVAEVVDGKVAALAPGSVTITVKTDDGGMAATCAIKIWAKAEATSDYIDEYGINHGRGIVIGGVVWAPVNCGYHATDYQYGKLYQWGRRYGQGYAGKLYVEPGKSTDYSDASVPTIEEGGVSIITGNHKNNENVFYKGTSESNYDWLYPQDDTLWNSGSESEPVKTDYDPCPEGWRVPTAAELNNLGLNYSSSTTYDGQNGFWFSGSVSYSESVSRVFFPAAGYLTGGVAIFRGRDGFYWSSRTYRNDADAFDIFSKWTGSGNNREMGFSVRCVQVTD